ncbi:MAG: hypothetical protein AAF619_04240 [Pseudomonadota bacterium]
MNQTPSDEPIAISAENLKAAVAEGILSADQSARLFAFSARQRGEATEYTSEDEPFRFVRGFRDVFIALGLILLFGGIAGSVLATFTTGLIFLPAEPLKLAGVFAILSVFAWLTGELVTARLRLPLASIVTVSAFAAAIGAATFYATVALFFDVSEGVVGILVGVSSIVATILYYIRFGLPFALLPIAAAGVLIFISLADTISPGAIQAHASIVFGLAGIFVFIIAMAYDTRDPQRITRFAECAFWLHLLAAPLIVHSLINALGEVNRLTTGSASLIVGIIVLIGLIALIIDRRALLVSTLIYLGTVVSFALGNTGLDGSEQFYVTLVVLGAFALTLGLGWLPLRRIVFSTLPESGFTRRLPKPT